MEVISVASCFCLGQALRNGDVEAFLEQYDALLGKLEHQTARLQLATAKEFARQISELPKEDFSLLQTAYGHAHLSNSQHSPISTEEPVVVQLLTLLDQLGLEEDSGAVSDLDSCLENSTTTELLSDSSSTHLIDECAGNKCAPTCAQLDSSKQCKDEDDVETIKTSLVVDNEASQSSKDDLTPHTDQSNDKVFPPLKGSKDEVNPPPKELTKDTSKDSVTPSEDSIKRKKSIPLSNSFQSEGIAKSKTKRRNKAQKTMNSTRTDQRKTCPADQYHKSAPKVLYESNLHPPRGGYDSRQQSKGHWRRGDRGWTKRSGRNSSRWKRPIHSDCERPSVGGSKAGGVSALWRDRSLPSVIYNHSEVASFLRKGWQTAKKELNSTS